MLGVLLFQCEAGIYDMVCCERNTHINQISTSKLAYFKQVCYPISFLNKEFET